MDKEVEICYLGMMKRATLIGSLVLMVGMLITIVVCAQLSKRTWVQHISMSMHVSFDYPDGWEILNDEGQNINPRLCPPSKERIVTRYLYANCITFFYGQNLWESNELEGENPVLREFAAVMDQTDRSFDEYKGLTANPVKTDTAVDLTALYRNGVTDMIGLWQGVCAPQEEAECSKTFEHVLHSLRFMGVKETGD